MHPRFILKVVWLEENVAFAVDHVIGKSTSPLTAYFFWPRDHAWEKLKEELDSKNWLTENEKIDLLNKSTEIMEFWQEKGKKISMLQAQSKFPEVAFVGTK